MSSTARPPSRPSAAAPRCAAPRHPHAQAGRPGSHPPPRRRRQRAPAPASSSCTTFDLDEYVHAALHGGASRLPPQGRQPRDARRSRTRRRRRRLPASPRHHRPAAARHGPRRRPQGGPPAPPPSRSPNANGTSSAAWPGGLTNAEIAGELSSRCPRSNPPGQRADQARRPQPGRDRRLGLGERTGLRQPVSTRRRPPKAARPGRRPEHARPAARRSPPGRWTRTHPREAVVARAALALVLLLLVGFETLATGRPAHPPAGGRGGRRRRGLPVRGALRPDPADRTGPGRGRGLPHGVGGADRRAARAAGVGPGRGHRAARPARRRDPPRARPHRRRPRPGAGPGLRTRPDAGRPAGPVHRRLRRAHRGRRRVLD